MFEMFLNGVLPLPKFSAVTSSVHVTLTDFVDGGQTWGNTGLSSNSVNLTQKCRRTSRWTFYTQQWRSCSTNLNVIDFNNHLSNL